MLRHDLRRALRVIVLETIADTFRHHLSDGRVARRSRFGDRPYHDIPVSDHADKAIVLADRQRANIIGPHTPRCVADCHVGIGNMYRRCHDVIDLHG
jgi:hypothetical protein